MHGRVLVYFHAMLCLGFGCIGSWLLFCDVWERKWWWIRRSRELVDSTVNRCVGTMRKEKCEGRVENSRL